MYTECPNCQTYFKITPNQLKAAGGKVRCGSCNEVFSALDGLVDVIPEEKLPDNDPRTEAATTSSEFKIDSSFVDSSALNAESDAFDEDPAQESRATTSASQEASDDVSQSFVDVEIPGMSGVVEEDVEAALASALVEEPVDQSSVDLSEIDKEDDKATDQKGINQDIDAALDGLFDSDTDLLGSSDSSPKVDSGVISELDELNDLDFGDLGKDESVASSVIGNDATGAMPTSIPSQAEDLTSLSAFERELGQMSEPSVKPDNKEKKASPVISESLDESSFDLGDSFLDSDTSSAQSSVSEHESRVGDSFILEELSESKAASGGKVAKFAWVTVILLLFVFLLGEFAYLKRQDLAMYPEAKPIIEDLCHQLNKIYPCDIAPAKDVTAIELLERNVVSHPNAKNALLITSTIVNNAEFDQAFPALVLTFSDINQKIIAKREFAPQEYLAKGVDINTGMRKSVPVKLMLEIVDPGEDAVNFEFNFH